VLLNLIYVTTSGGELDQEVIKERGKRGAFRQMSGMGYKQWGVGYRESLSSTAHPSTEVCMYSGTTTEIEKTGVSTRNNCSHSFHITTIINNTFTQIVLKLRIRKFPGPGAMASLTITSTSVVSANQIRPIACVRVPGSWLAACVVQAMAWELVRTKPHPRLAVLYLAEVMYCSRVSHGGGVVGWNCFLSCQWYGAK